MGFKRVSPTEEVNKRIEQDPEFKSHYDVSCIEYELIKQLTDIRKNLEITQPQIEKKVGLTQQMVSRIEKFGNSPRLDNFIKYVYSLGLEIKFEKIKS